MAVTFDAVGPSSAGVSASSAQVASLSWTHTVGAGVTSGAVVVYVNADGTDTSPVTCAVTCAGTPMTSLHAPTTTTVGANNGDIQAFGLTGVTPGAKTIAVTLTLGGGFTANLLGVSHSFDGAAGFGTAVVGNADSTPSIAVASNTSGNLISAGFASGSAITAASAPATQQSLDNVSTSNSTGNLSSATSPATGSSVTVAWTGGGGSCCLVAVEVQVPAGTDSSAGYATSAADLGGGSGSWVNPGNADNAPNATYATWTAP